MTNIELDKDVLLYEGMTKCVEIIELQNIFSLSKDGYFGIRTSEKLKRTCKVQFIKLSDLEELGFKVRKEIPESEVWWMQIKQQ